MIRFLRRERCNRLLINTAVLPALFIAIASGCKKDEPKSTATTSVEAAAVGQSATTSAVDFSGTLVTRIPANSYGFVAWDGKHAAYSKLLASPWNGGTDFSALLSSANEETKRLSEILTQAGLNPSDKETWRKTFAQAVFFVAPKAGGLTPEPVVGGVFRSDGVSLPEKVKAIKTELAKEPESEVKDLTVAGAQGFSMLMKHSPRPGEEKPAPTRLYFAATDDLGVIAADQTTLEGVFASKGDTLPDVVKTEQFKGAVAGFPDASSRFILGYFDATKLASAPNQPQSAEQQLKDNAIQAVSFSVAMDDAPQTDLRLLFDTKTPSNAWLSASTTNLGTSLLSAVPEQPLVFFSIDGQTVRKVKDSVAAQGGPGQAEMLAGISFIDSIKRMGIAARFAPAGQSILPIPDVLLVVETDKAAEASAQLQQILALATQTSPTTASMAWTDKTLEGGAKVKSMVSPLGVGVFLGTAGDLVLLSSSEDQMNSVITGKTKSAFENKLTGRAKTVLVKSQSLGNLYVNFEEVATFLENMGGLLAMYAPQNKEASKFLEPESLAQFKKMGKMVAVVTVKDGVVGIQSFYQS